MIVGAEAEKCLKHINEEVLSPFRYKIFFLDGSCRL